MDNADKDIESGHAFNLENGEAKSFPTRDDLNDKLYREAKKVFDVATEDDLSGFYSEVEIKYQILKELQNIFMSEKMVQALMLKDNPLDEAYRFYLAGDWRDRVFLAVFDYLEKEGQGQSDTNDIDCSVGNDDEELEP